MTLKLTFWHFFIWFLFGFIAAMIAVRACFVYNSQAGTDKTSKEIAIICVSTALGPMVGPIANPGATGRSWFICMTFVLVCGSSLSILPFVIVKRPVSNTIYFAAWVVFVMMTVVWFSSAVGSLAYCLS